MVAGPVIVVCNQLVPPGTVGPGLAASTPSWVFVVCRYQLAPPPLSQTRFGESKASPKVCARTVKPGRQVMIKTPSRHHPIRKHFPNKQSMAVNKREFILLLLDLGQVEVANPKHKGDYPTRTAPEIGPEGLWATKAKGKMHVFESDSVVCTPSSVTNRANRT